MKEQFAKWFKLEEIEHIDGAEVYQFLQSIQHEAIILEMGGLFQTIAGLMEDAENMNNSSWLKSDLKSFLHGLIELSHECEFFFDHDEFKKLPIRNEDVPLIQLIDEDVSMLIVLKEILENKGWMVIASTDTEKAIEQFYDMHPDCLIIDLNLPEKKGFKILEDVQKHTNQKFIPKIMVSVLSDRQTRIMAYKMGVDDFIKKPIDIEEFLVRVERHLERKKYFDQSVLIDELTKVYNRKYLKYAYERNMNDLIRSNNYFTIAVIDLDRF